MLSFLKDHPFSVESLFETSLVLTFAVPQKQLENLIPECLTLDSLDEEFAFLAVALVKTKHLRPKGFPRFMGNDFALIGYRIFVRYITSEGKRLRGLYIISSETDKRLMVFLGNIFSHYNYQLADINFFQEKGIIRVQSDKSDLNIEVKNNGDAVKLPVTSPFKDWKEARRFAGPLPFTFTYDPLLKEVLIIEGVRTNWTPKPVEVIQSHVGFINRLGLMNVILANAFVISDVPYYWKKGKKDLWKQS